MGRAVFSWVLSFACIGWSGAAAWASARADDPFLTYYTIKERPLLQWEGPVEILQQAMADSATLDLLQMNFHNQRFPSPAQPYNRRNHFGNWVNDPRDDNCYNTRAKVLIRDSRRPVVFQTRNRCSVQSGEWAELYGGTMQHQASEIEIDHVVALKNAYISGAHRWTWNARCLYANYLGNEYHLLPVFKTENRRKSDRTPADWMPSDRRAHCAHLINWLRIKLVWGLVLGDREARTIGQLARQSGCDPKWFKVSAAVLAQQRQVIGRNMELCERLGPGDGEEGQDRR